MKGDLDEYGGEVGDIKFTRNGKRGLSLLKPETFGSFKNPIYRLYFGALLSQRASANMQMMIRSLLIYRITGSAIILGGMSLARALPSLFFALFGGIIADRVQKKYVLLFGQLGLAVVSLGVAIALTMGYLSSERAGSWWLLVLASVLNGIIMGIMAPSRQAIIPEIVGEERLMNAIALNNLAKNVLRAMIPAMMGFFIDLFDFAAIYYIMSGLYLVSVIFVIFMPPTGTINIRGTGALAEIKEGLRYVSRETTILLILFFTLFIVLLSRPYTFLLPIFTEDILKVGATGMGILMSVSGIGAMVGSLALASLPNRRRGLMLLVSSILLGLALMSFSFSSSWYLSLVLVLFVGLGQAGRMTLGNTLLLSYSAEEYRGRVMSLHTMEQGLTGLGAFFAGIMAEAIGVQWAVGGLAMALAMLAVLALVLVPRIRKLD